MKSVVLGRPSSLTPNYGHLEIRMRERQFPHPQSGRIELNLDLSLCPSTLRKRDGLLSQQERRDKKVEQNSCFRSRETKQRNSEKNTENLRKEKKKKDMNSLVFIILLGNMFSTSYSQWYWRISNGLTFFYSILLRKQALFLQPVKPRITCPIIHFVYQWGQQGETLLV